MGSHEFALNFAIAVSGGLVTTAMVLAYQRVVGKAGPISRLDMARPYLMGAVVLIFIAGALTFPNVSLFADGGLGTGNPSAAATPLNSSQTTPTRAPASPVAGTDSARQEMSAPPACSDYPADWPATPQEAASAFGGQPDNWYPDYQQNGTWNGRAWAFQDSSLQHGVVLNSNGDYTDGKGQVLRLPSASRYMLWDYGSPLTRPSLHLGELGEAGRVQMFIRTGDHGRTWVMTKRWGYGSAVFDEAEGGVANLVSCANDQIGRAAFDAHHDCVDGMANIEGYRMLLWNEDTRQFESGACS